jgi:hypothetical protein
MKAISRAMRLPNNTVSFGSRAEASVSESVY